MELIGTDFVLLIVGGSDAVIDVLKHLDSTVLLCLQRLGAQFQRPLARVGDGLVVAQAAPASSPISDG